MPGGNKKGAKPDDPFSAPRLVHCCQFCNISFLLAILVALRLGVLGVLCCPWSIISLLNLIKSVPKNVQSKGFDLDVLFTPHGNGKNEADDDLFRVVASCTYLMDIIVCISTSLTEHCTVRLARIKTLCFIWLVFIGVSILVYVWGAVRFIMLEQYIFIFYVDLVSLPLIFLLIVVNLLWLESLLDQGYIAFPKQTSNQARLLLQRPPRPKPPDSNLIDDPDFKRVFENSPQVTNRGVIPNTPDMNQGQNNYQNFENGKPRFPQSTPSVTELRRNEMVNSSSDSNPSTSYNSASTTSLGWKGQSSKTGLADSSYANIRDADSRRESYKHKKKRKKHSKHKR